ncbi:MAG: hypothetical protein GX856_06570 [Gammaproteobacteria bacterium]|nr:hypothetical protein [Gammaproteobacteria bacterium]
MASEIVATPDLDLAAPISVLNDSINALLFAAGKSEDEELSGALYCVVHGLTAAREQVIGADAKLDAMRLAAAAP